MIFKGFWLPSGILTFHPMTLDDLEVSGLTIEACYLRLPAMTAIFPALIQCMSGYIGMLPPWITIR